MGGKHYLVEKVYFAAFIHSDKAYDAEGSASYGHESCAPGTRLQPVPFGDLPIGLG